MGVISTAYALPMAFVNSYYSFVRPTLYRRWHGLMEGYRFVSNFPLIGNIPVVTGGIAGFGDWRAAVIGLIALDTGGLPWLLVMIWRDSGFWDE